MFHVLPQDIFLLPYQRRGHPYAANRRPVSDLELLRRLGLMHGAFLPQLMKTEKPEDCCRGRNSSTCDRSCMKGQECPASVDTNKGTKVDKREAKQIATLDFRGFAPEDIKVKVTDKAINIRAEQKTDHSTVLITKSIPLPEGADKTGVVCRYIDGYVILQLPPEDKPSLEQKTEKEPESKSQVQEQKPDSDSKAKGDAASAEKENQAEFEESMKSLADLFSTIFGLDVKDEDKEEKKEDAEKKEPAKTENGVRSIPISQEKEAEKEGERSETESCTSADGSQQQDSDQTCVMTTGEQTTSEKQGADDSTAVDSTSASAPVSKSEGAAAKSTEPKKFNVELDLSNYKPEDIHVMYKDGYVIVDAERVVKEEDYSEVERLSRCIRVPENVEKSMLETHLSPEGVVTVRGPYKKVTDDGSNVRIIKVVLED